MADVNREFINLPRWECPWYWVEVLWVLRISDKILWWASMTGIEGYELLKIMLRAFDKPLTGLGSLQQHLETDAGYGHPTPMSKLLEYRMKLLACPSPEEILAAALGDPTGAWKKLHGHLDSCQGSCGSEMEHLRRYTLELGVIKGLRLPSAF